MGFRRKSTAQRTIPFLALSFLFATAPGFLPGQEPVKPATPQPTQPKPDLRQAYPEEHPAPAAQDGTQTGSQTGAQVRTGSVLGSDTFQNLMNHLGALLADHQVVEAEQILQESDNATDTDGKPKLTQPQAQMLRGVLANRENKSEESIRLLEPLAQSMAAQPPSEANPDRQKLVEKALAEDYLRLGDWAKAAAAYQALGSQLGASLTPEEKSEMELPMKLLPLVASHPPMTVETGAPFALPYDRDALGLTDVPVFIDAQSHDWMLDPTAPFNLISHSIAKQIGLKLSEATATVTTITGRPMLVRATLIPRFTLGTMTFRNMTAFVFEDADYYFPRSQYQVRGVLGYPAVSALGSLTITADARIEVQPGEKGERLTNGARFFLDGDQILAALGKPGQERMFILDAGGQQTYLTARYYAEHSDDFANKKMQFIDIPGPSSAARKQPPVPAYVADSLILNVGDTPMTFHYLNVLTQPLDSAAIDDTYGTLGMDALDELKSYTFDYRTMRFGVKPE